MKPTSQTVHMEVRAVSIDIRGRGLKECPCVLRKVGSCPLLIASFASFASCASSILSCGKQCGAEGSSVGLWEAVWGCGKQSCSENSCRG